MLKKRIIPCLDVHNGRVVKGVNFVDLVDAGNPVEQAKIYEEQGADELCFLDISASHEGRDNFYHIVEQVAETCFMPLTVGGGVSSVEHISNLLKSGADKVSINSAAIRNPELVKAASDKFGAQCIIVAIDAKYDESTGEYFIYTHGGRQKTNIEAISWAEKMQEYGAGEILLTSMDKDGTKSGFNNDLNRRVNNVLEIPVIASGGVGELQHFVDGVTLGNCDALLAASVFHFGTFTINQVKQYMLKHGIDVRM